MEWEGDGKRAETLVWRKWRMREEERKREEGEWI